MAEEDAMREPERMNDETLEEEGNAKCAQILGVP
jgi:hypothetical protein